MVSQFQSLEGFLVDGNSEVTLIDYSDLSVSIPRRVFGWWELSGDTGLVDGDFVSIPRRVFGWWEPHHFAGLRQSIQFQSLEGFLVDGNIHFQY